MNPYSHGSDTTSPQVAMTLDRLLTPIKVDCRINRSASGAERSPLSCSIPAGHVPGAICCTGKRKGAQDMTFAIGGRQPVNRLGYGAMQITGPGV